MKIVSNVSSNGVGAAALRKILRPALCLVWSILFVQTATAQSTQQFVGHVVDTSQAVVPAATVTVHNENTGENFVVKTTGAGDYTATYLKPGVYTVTVDKAGFKTVSQTHITLDIDQNAKI